MTQKTQKSQNFHFSKLFEFFLPSCETSPNKQGITNTLAPPIDKMLYIYLFCPHSKHQNNMFQSKQSKHFHQRNWFTQCETGFNKVKLPKVGSNAIILAPIGAWPNKLYIKIVGIKTWELWESLLWRFWKDPIKSHSHDEWRDIL